MVSNIAVKRVLFYPARELREKCTDIEDFTSDEFLALMQDLANTLASYGAIGLAAPQLGVPKRVFVTFVEGQLHYFINPKITRKEGSITTKEGCLSFPGVFERIERFSEVTIEAIDADGKEFTCELNGMDAVSAQHEYDHLDGVLFIDKVSILLKKMMLKKLGKFKKKFNIK
jgi:peptide deformylase